MTKLLQATFNVTEGDKGNKKFDKVIRIEAESDDSDNQMYLVLDLHGELFMINEDDTLDLVLASSTDEKLMKKYDYVMFGRVFKFETSTIKDEEMTSVLISYGGLIMRLTASPQQLKPIEPDSDVYLLLRKK